MTKNFLYFAFLDFIVRKGGSRAAATSKMERLVIIVNGFHVAAALDPPLFRLNQSRKNSECIEFLFSVNQLENNNT